MDGTGSDSDEKWVSVITCDMEGRIKTFNDGAEKIFGYSKEEIIGKKRVSMFSPGTIVLGHVGNWLSEASQNGEYRGKTAFVRKDRSKFAANIKITPTYKTIDGKKIQIGYCGRTEPLFDEDPEAAIPPTSFTTKLITGLVILRLPFVTAALIPAILALVWAHWNGMVDNGVWGLGVMGILFAAAFLHLSANVFNDYFDVKNGVDDANNDYFLQYSGGSRAVELGLITLRG
ncbi:MAG TPA: PAS domain S-box protein, partial [Candidatus Poseidoniales archaeon]|nr:PAS domain S-box protein [Candidatus Poseidoniales archaeon]